MKGPIDAGQGNVDDFFSNPYARMEEAIEKKKRNLEKRKIKLQQYQEDERNGKKLTGEQMEAQSRIGEVESQLELIKDITKTLSTLQKDYGRAAKQRDEANKKKERKQLAEMINYQLLFKAINSHEAMKAFEDGTHGAIVLDEEERALLEEVSRNFNPTWDACESLEDLQVRCDESAYRAHSVITATKERLFEKFSGAHVKNLMERVTACSFMQEMGCFKAHSIASDTSSDEEEKQIEDEETEESKKGPKVVFVHGEGEGSEQSVDGEVVKAISPEFGFEGYGSPQSDVAVRDPPPPIPLPSETRAKETVPNGADYSVDGSPNDAVWSSNNEIEVKPETASEAANETAENATAGEHSGTQAIRGERRSRGHRGGVRNRNGFSRGDGGHEHVRYPRDDRYYPREPQDIGNNSGHSRTRGGRGGGNTMRSGGNASGYGGRGGTRSYANGTANGYGGYANANPPRQAGFNFAPMPMRNGGDSRK